MHTDILSPRVSCIALLAALLLSGCSQSDSSSAEESTLRDHVERLADPGLNGRLAGTPGEASAANYISDRFLAAGLRPAGENNTYLQQFTLTGPMPQAMDLENRISRNVAGMIEGTGNSGQYIIVGAHYDSQGTGGMISMDSGEEPAVHPGADDNASGTAALIELAEHFSENVPSKHMLFIAFSGEELGLLGARHFMEETQISPDSIAAMINMDMIGRMEENQVTIFGTGTSDRWNELLDELEPDSLDITRTPSGTGASDHTAFYDAGIPVLHYFTGTHGDYHRSSDTADKINYRGIQAILDHVTQVIERLDRIDAREISFRESSDPHSGRMDFSGPTLGVLPDYAWSGEGFRIDGVRDGDPADRGGMMDGDVIIRMGGVEIGDIYDYMDNLSEFEQGDRVVVTVLRDGEEVELDIEF